MQCTLIKVAMKFIAPMLLTLILTAHGFANKPSKPLKGQIDVLIHCYNSHYDGSIYLRQISMLVEAMRLITD